MKTNLPPCDLVRNQPRTSEAAVILPVYNEMPTLKCIIDAISVCWKGDIIVVDDASTDGSGEYLETCHDIILLRNRRNAGAGGVLLRGFATAIDRGYQAVVTMDSDGQHNAVETNSFIQELYDSGADMV